MSFIFDKIGNLGNLVGPFFLLLGALIFIHEWGHFIVARICGVRVEIFSIGFGPTIFKFKWGDTDYRLSLIPLGGYVKMYGDEEGKELPESERKHSFIHKSLISKISVVAAGPIMNLIFAIILFSLLGSFGAPEVDPVIGDITPDSTAARSNFIHGDRVLRVNGDPIRFWGEFDKALSKFENGANARIDILRDGQEISIVAPVAVEPSRNPLSLLKNSGRIDGLSPFKVSAKVGIDYRSPLLNLGASSLDKVQSVNDIAISGYTELQQVVTRQDPAKPIKLTFQRIDSTDSYSISVTPEMIESGYDLWSLDLLGITKPELFIGHVVSGSPAEKAGIQKGFQILEINDVLLSGWVDLVNQVKKTKKNEKIKVKAIDYRYEPVVFFIEPNITESILPTGKIDRRPTIGVGPGLEILPPKTIYVKETGVKEVFLYGVRKSYEWTLITINSFKKIFIGEISHKALSGVITIGQVAKESLAYGWSYFVQMMAIISINLFLLNLLPVPVLDGGHLLFYFVELVKGSPISLRTRAISQQIGVVLILCLIVLTLFNDITRLLFS